MSTDAAAAEASGLEVVDTHQHMWYPTEWKCPWLADPSCASINREFSMADYMNAMEGNNVVKTVFLETDAAKDNLELEASFVGRLCADPSVPVAGAVIGCSLDDDAGFKEYIDKMRTESFVKGVRDVMHPKEKGFCLKPAVLSNIQYLGECGLSCDICIQPDQLNDCAEMVRQCPGTTFIIDHCGGHQGLKGTCPAAGDTDPVQKAAWESGIAELASLPNAIAKISGLYGGWQGGWDSWAFESQTATMDYVLDQFPEDRVVLGSDWPVCEGACPGSHAKYVAATKKYVVEKRGLDAAKKLLSENAIRVYRL